MTNWKTKAIGWVFSIALHLLILFFAIPFPLYIVPPGGEEQKTEKKATEVTLLVKPVTEIVPEQKKNDKPSLTPKYQTDELICMGKDKTYIGVGLIYQPGSNMVTRAPQGLPAYEAGIRVGDFIVNPDEPIKNGKVHFQIRRSYTQMEFDVKADNICFNEG